MSEYPQIADGYDNTAGLTPLHQLSTPLFWRFYMIQSEWHDYESREWSGSRIYVPIGRPWVVWRFFVLTPDELAYLRANFGVAVTIRTLNKTTNLWSNYNATLALPDAGDGNWATWDYGAEWWTNVRLEFRDLEGIA